MYEEFYKLRAKPFRLSPDPRFFFESRGHRRALAYLRYGLRQSEGFVVITGEPGTGKTTLAQILLAEMNQSDVVVAHLTTTQLEADEMLRMVAGSFGLRYEGLDKAGLLKTLEAFLLARSRERKRALLVVDEAQNLPPSSLEELRMLSNLQVGDHALFQTFLLGQVQFRQMLDHPDLEQLRQRVIANYHLSPLATDECKSYVESRLANAGWEQDPKFTDEAYEIIFDYTGGIPRRINMLCDRILLFSCLEELHVIDKKVLLEVTDELQAEISGKPIGREVAPEDNEADPEATQNISRSGADSRSVTNGFTADVASESPAKQPNEHQAHAPSRGSDEVPAASEVKHTDQRRHRNQDDSGHHEPPLLNPAAMNESIRKAQQAGQSWGEAVARKARDEEDAENAHGEVSQPAAASDAGRATESETVSPGRDRHPERFRVIHGGKVVAPRFPADSARDGTLNDKPQRDKTLVAATPDVPGDSDEVSLRKALRLILAYHRSPRSFPGLDDPDQPIPRGLPALLALAAGEDTAIQNMRQVASMGISPNMLRAAVRYYIRRVLFVPGGDDFRVLGLAKGASLSDIEDQYGHMMKLMRMETQDADETGVATIGHAYENLCRGELMPVRDIKRDDAELEDDEEVDTIEVLDLDLSPNAIGGMVAGRRIAPEGTGKNVSGVITGREATAPTARNIFLLLAVIAVIVLLYFTQYRETILSPSDSPVPATSAISEPGATDVSQRPTVNRSLTEDSLPGASATAAATPAQGNLPSEGEKATDRPGTAPDTQTMTAGQGSMEELPPVSPPQESSAEADSTTGKALPPAASVAADSAPPLGTETEQTEAVAAEAEKVHAATEAQLRAEAEARQAAEQQAKLKTAELEIIRHALKDSQAAAAAANARAEQEAKARAEAELRARQEAEARAKVVAEARAKAQAQAQAQAQAEAKAKAEAARQVALAEQSAAAEKIADAGSVKTLEAAIPPSSSGVASANQISIDEINQALSQLQDAYQRGDLGDFLSLFSETARTSSRTDLAGIRNEYQAHFDATSYRKISIKEMEWKFEEDFVSGSGQFAAEYLPAGKIENVSRVGGVIIQLEKQSQDIKITRMYFFGTDGLGVFP